jgi:glycerol-3-phosphate acyltransferase PlsX
VGNIALKASEGAAEFLLNFFKEHIENSFKYKMGYLLLKDIFKSLKKKTDYAETGGAPLLGVDGVCIICHGKSNGKAIHNAILQAKQFAENNLNGSIQKAMQVCQTLHKAKEI